MKYIQCLLVIVLLLCLFPMPYGYFILVRYLSTIVFLLMAYNYYHQKKNKLYYFWIVMAVLFQPILKIALGRIVWNIIDVIIAVLLLLVLWKQNNEIKK